MSIKVRAEWESTYSKSRLSAFTVELFEGNLRSEAHQADFESRMEEKYPNRTLLTYTEKYGDCVAIYEENSPFITSLNRRRLIERFLDNLAITGLVIFLGFCFYAILQYFKLV